MGRRKFTLSVHRKNQERKKYDVTTLPISMDLTHIEVFQVSIPRHLVEAPRLSLSLPLSSFTTGDAPSIQSLLNRLLRIELLPHWVTATESGPLIHQLTLCKLRQQQVADPVSVIFTLAIGESFQWNLMFVHHNIDGLRDRVLAGTPPSLRTVHHVLQLLSRLDSSKICVGNPEERFLEVASHRVEHTASGEYSSIIDSVCRVQVCIQVCTYTLNSLSSMQHTLTGLFQKRPYVRKLAN